ncbi:MAG: type II toxin-antitoxin system VapC family toxin [bacterium]
MPVPQVVVVDCSVSGPWFLRDEARPETVELLRDIMHGKLEFLAPDLWWYETINLLRSAIRQRRMESATARAALQFGRDIPRRFVTARELADGEILGLACEHGLTAYDATYLAVAMQTGATLLTADKELLSLHRHFPFVMTCEKHHAMRHAQAP